MVNNSCNYTPDVIIVEWRMCIYVYVNVFVIVFMFVDVCIMLWQRCCA